MTYAEFKQVVQAELRRHRRGTTWIELKTARRLPYDRPCPEWTRRLEKEIGLVRRKGDGRSLVWFLHS